MYVATANGTILESEFDRVEDTDEIGSFNHGYVQARLIVLLDRIGAYTPVNELSSAPAQWRTVSSGDVVDEALGIHLAMEEIFA
jgi:hypothetical protein